MLKKIKNFILSPWHKYKARQLRKKRLKALRDQDPFIYE